jgi:NAD+ diphosphatase
VTREPNAFTGAALDRAGDGRRLDAAWLAEQRAHPAARALVAGDRGLRVRDGRLELVPLASLNGAAPVLLGLDDHGPVYAHDEDSAHEGLPPLIGAGGMRGEPPPGSGGERLALRAAAATLSRADGGLAAYACALLNWHRRHRFCANCGHDTELVEGGLTRRCPRCGAEHHPRTDPVVIMLVTDGAERLLLGRQAAWPSGRYSALAGFVEPGESLEEAVAREVREETAVRVGRPRYIASQPWPFPASLMLGFSAPHAGGEPEPTTELQDARWFTRAQMRKGAEAGALVLPGGVSISRSLVEDWYGGPLPGSW